MGGPGIEANTELLRKWTPIHSFDDETEGCGSLRSVPHSVNTTKRVIQMMILLVIPIKLNELTKGGSFHSYILSQDMISP